GPRAVVLATEPLPGAPETADHLVRRKEDAVFVDDALDFGPVSFGWNDQAARALHRLADEGRDPVRADFLDLLRQLARAPESELGRREVASLAEPVRLVDVDDAGDGAVRTELLVHRLHSAERRARHGAAVITIPARNDHVSLRLSLNLPVAADQTQQRVVRLAAGARVENVVELRRRHFLEDSRQLDRGRGRALEEAVVVRQLL